MYNTMLLHFQRTAVQRITLLTLYKIPTQSYASARYTPVDPSEVPAYINSHISTRRKVRPHICS